MCTGICVCIRMSRGREEGGGSECEGSRSRGPMSQELGGWCLCSRFGKSCSQVCVPHLGKKVACNKSKV